MKPNKNLTIQFRAKTFNFASFFLPRKDKDIENLYIFVDIWTTLEIKIIIIKK